MDGMDAMDAMDEMDAAGPGARTRRVRAYDWECG